MTEIKAVAVLTTFQDLPRSYGLVPVVMNQLRVLKAKGYEVGFYTQNGFQNHPDSGDVPEGVELLPYVPFCHLYDYHDNAPEQKSRVDGEGKRVGGQVRTNFKKQAKYIQDSLEPWLMEYPTVITHDIVFQSWFVPHNQAIRNIAENHPDIRWLHWLHSGPSPPPKKPTYPTTLRYSPFPNSVFVSPNESMRAKFAEMYDVPINSVKTVYHTFDPIKWWNMHDLSKQMIRRHRLLDCDGLIVYPTRIDHPEAKGMFDVIRLVAMMNRYANIKFLFLNSWSGNKKAKGNIERMRREAKEWGLPQQNLIFSSEMDKRWENGVPKEVVEDMYNIGTMHISGSQTETFSLSALEAAAHKCMLVLNEDLTVFKELAGDRADYIQVGSEWGGEKVTRHYWGPEGEDGEEDPKAHWRETAIKLLARLGYVDYTCEHCGKDLHKIGAYNPLRQHRHVLRTFNPDVVWEKQLEPLLKGDW